MIQLYKGIAFSPQAELTADIGAEDTVIKVSDVSVFPDAPNLATIGSDEGGETILYTAKSEEALSGRQRGVEGEAKAWKSGEIIARNFTAKDHNDLIKQVGDTDSALQNKAGKAVPSAEGNVAELAADGSLRDSGVKLEDKQDKLTFDKEPAAGSENPVESQGVFSALEKKQNNLVFDKTPTAGSVNPVESQGVQEALDKKQNKLTGKQRQVIGFDESGNAVAQDAPVSGYVHYFTEEDWQGSQDEYTITVANSTHKMTGSAVTCIAMTKDSNSYIQTTFAAIQTYATIDGENAITIHASDAYTGLAILTAYP